MALLPFFFGACEADRTPERERMVRVQLEARGIRDPRVLEAMRRVPRERFVPAALAPEAYDDGPLPIGLGQTISQPYIVAFMTEALQVEPGMKVLEIGTGSGYQAAVLLEMGARVWSVEIVPELGARAARLLGGRATLRVGDGWRGWPEAAPFDRILVTAAPEEVPRALEQQLVVGGRMLVPVGGGELQELLVIDRVEAELWLREPLLPVRFVPMTGEGPGG